MFIQTDQAQLFSTAFGNPSAPALLGIGGWIGSWELWLPPFEPLSRSWFAVGFDHRGSGATVCAPEAIRFEALVDDVFAVMDAYGLERCVLAGESAGASVALGAALRRPERVSGLVLVDGAYSSNSARRDSPFLKGLKHAYPQTLAAFVEACVPEPDSAYIKRWGRQILDRASPENAIALYEMMAEVDLRGEVHKVGQPTLVIHGDKDVIAPLEDAHFLHQHLPNSRLLILEGAGHVPTLTRPQAVAEAINAFFDQTP
ncbi:MAG: alpha/beta hydrolase [Meiothermus sp.]|nr:alpha/beta hydrolase [Meiothermus sp.]